MWVYNKAGPGKLELSVQRVGGDMFMTDEEISKLTDDQLFNKLGVVFENGMADEQDPSYLGTPAHHEMLDLHWRLIQEYNRRLERQDHGRMDHLEKRKSMPEY